MRQVIAWIRNLPEDSAVARAQEPEAVAWGLHGQIMAAIADLLAVANWQRGGGQGPMPRPIQRPGIEDGGTRHGGDTGLDNDEVMAILHGYRTGEYAETETEDGGDEA